MSKAIRVVVGVIVVAGVGWVAGAWYTGKRLGEVLPQQVEQANTRLQEVLPGSHATVSLVRQDRHWFSTDVLLRVQFESGAVSGQPAARQDVLDVISHIGHGPFPLDRLKRGQLLPVMAAGVFALQENDTVRPWFELTHGVPPLSGRAALGYGQSVSGTLRTEPLKLTRDDASLDLSGLVLDFSQDRDRRTRLHGTMDSATVDVADDDKAARLKVDGVTLSTDVRPGPAGLQVGTNTLTVKQVALTPPGRPPITLADYTQRTDASEDKGALSVHGEYAASMLTIGSADIGSVQVALGARNLAPEAVKTLLTLYGRIWSRSAEQAQHESGEQQVPEPVLTPEEQAQALEARHVLLAANPNFYIDPILLKTPRGEARFTLNLDLSDPGSPDQPLDERLAKALRKLDARAAVAQPVLAGLLSENMRRQGMDAAAADAQAQALAAIIGKAAADSGYATLQGSDVVSTLHYADGTVDLNGTKMPLDQFAGMVLQGVIGMMGPQDGVMDEPDDQAPDQDDPEENQDQAPSPDTPR